MNHFNVELDRVLAEMFEPAIDRWMDTGNLSQLITDVTGRLWPHMRAAVSAWDVASRTEDIPLAERDDGETYYTLMDINRWVLNIHEAFAIYGVNWPRYQPPDGDHTASRTNTPWDNHPDPPRHDAKMTKTKLAKLCSRLGQQLKEVGGWLAEAKSFNYTDCPHARTLYIEAREMYQLVTAAVTQLKQFVTGQRKRPDGLKTTG